MALALAAALLALFWPALAWLWATWRVHPYYAHGPFAVAAAGWLVWRGRGRFHPLPSPWGWPMLVASLFVQVAAARTGSMPLSCGALLGVAAALVALVYGTSGLRAVALPVALAALAIPIPLAERLAPLLAAGAAHAAASSAGAAGVAVHRSGAQLALSGGAFTVGAPCSGLRSLLALWSTAMVLAAVIDGPARRRAALVAAALPVALGANWLRLTGLLVVSNALGVGHGLELFDGLTGSLFFLLAVAALVALARLFGCGVPRTA
jgi:exosortase